MSVLSAARITASQSFLTVRIDYGEPFIIKVSKNKMLTKLICVFLSALLYICVVHLELVVDLNTSTFIRTLQRFIARRSKYANIYSNNARNFIGGGVHKINYEKSLTYYKLQSIIQKYQTF